MKMSFFPNGTTFAVLPSAAAAAAAAAKSLQSCPTLCDPIDGSLPGSTVPGILQARTLEWVAISCSKVWKWKVKGKSLSRVQPLATPWTAAYQAPLSMGFSRQEYWSGVPLPSPVLPSRFPANHKCYHPLLNPLSQFRKRVSLRYLIHARSTARGISASLIAKPSQLVGLGF